MRWLRVEPVMVENRSIPQRNPKSKIQNPKSEYASGFDKEIGAPGKLFRMALGALIIKEKLGTSDRETVEQIQENPYLQYFIGMTSYSNKTPFDASMMVHFRERIDISLVNKVNQEIVKKMREITALKSGEKKQKTQKKKQVNVKITGN